MITTCYKAFPELKVIQVIKKFPFITEPKDLPLLSLKSTTEPHSEPVIMLKDKYH
jgi:hypothetical protein